MSAQQNLGQNQWGLGLVWMRIRIRVGVRLTIGVAFGNPVEQCDDSSQLC